MSAEYVSHETQSLEEVHRVLLELKLRHIGTEEIKVRDAPWTAHAIFPGITVWNVGKRFGAGTNEREDVGYGCGVTMVTQKSGDPEQTLDRLPYWEGVIRREFSERTRLAIDDMLKGCSGGEVRVGEINAKPPPQNPESHNYKFRSLAVWVWFRETRGLIP